MLRPVLDPLPVPAPAPVMPWVIDRRDRLHPVLVNASSGTLEITRLFVQTPRRPLRVERWGLVSPGGSVTVCLCGVDLDEVAVSVAWFRPDDDSEFIWAFVP